MDAEVDRIAEVSGRRAQVVDEQSESGWQRQRDANDDKREQRGERSAYQPAQGTEQGLQVARAV
jgi:hypothetical protein